MGIPRTTPGTLPGTLPGAPGRVPARRATLRTARRRLAAAACAGALTLGLGACGADDEPAARAGAETASDATGSDPDGPRLVQGGEPGETAEEVPADTTAPTNEWTQDDETFMREMIPHHAQALEMTALVPSRSDDPRIQRLAERIEAAQGPEIAMMAAWLDERSLEVPRAGDEHGGDGHGGHGDEHGQMAGMLTQPEMERLAAARGAEFDRLFLTSMIGHHEGALQMADDTAGGGLDVLVGEHRDGITSSQSAEIARMRQLLDDV